MQGNFEGFSKILAHFASRIFYNFERVIRGFGGKDVLSIKG